MFRHFFTLQFMTFLGVGVTAATLNWLTRWVLNESFGFSLAIVVAYLIGMACAFILNRLFVFVKVNRPLSHQARDFFLVNLMVFPVVYFLAIVLNQLLQWLGFVMYTEEIAHAMALAIPMMLTFLIYKFFTFKSE